MPKVRLNLSIGYAGADRNEVEDIDDAFWESLTAEEREKYLDELSRDWANNYVEYNAEIED